MKNKILILALFFISILPACGFDKFLKKLDEKKKQAESTIQNSIVNPLTSNSTNAQPNALIPQKVESPRETINQIINCYNHTQPAIAVTEHDYFSSLQSSLNSCKYSRPVPSSMDLTSQLSSISSHLGKGLGGYNGKKAVEVCKKSLVFAEKDLAHYASVVNFLKPYVEILEVLVSDLEKSKAYYSQQNYKDDACAQGKSTFDKITTNLDAMRGKSIGIAIEMDKIKRNLDTSELAEMERKEGRKFVWYYMSFTIEAENLLKTLHLEQNGKYNAIEYQQNFPNFEKIFQELSAYATSHPEEDKVKSAWSRVESSSNAFYAKAKILNREMATSKASENALDDFVRAYNRYIEDMNRQVFDRF